MALGAATTYQPDGHLPARRYSSRTTAATVPESCSLGTKVLTAICHVGNRFTRRGIIRVLVLERALVCLTLSADTSYDGKLPSAGVAQWQSEGLIIPRPWVRFPPPAPMEPARVWLECRNLLNPRRHPGIQLRIGDLKVHCARLCTNRGCCRRHLQEARETAFDQRISEIAQHPGCSDGRPVSFRSRLRGAR